ncbi:hypothetical protein [Lysinibacter sp. HNR]|uniref:coiled-coil domain-containing protein n=1 Tax=Lysinibacter sp. HNR TaxID=3031408 RepID=UPI002435C0ED|nr:hypothetical protein [Lysinibacter sp. HNR]WGD38005.1 hypothetical protein FrondiHNR_03555 [Lysinibacter sp. HNR]
MVSRKNKQSRTALIRATASALTVPLVFSAWLPTPALANTSPSWDDVLAARGNVTKTQSLVSSLEKDLTTLQNTAGQLGNEAVSASLAAVTAQSDLAESEKRSQTLAAQLDTAKVEAQAATRNTGAVISDLYTNRVGQALTAELFTASDPERFLHRLASLEQVSSRNAILAAEATSAANTVSSLTEQAQAASRQQAELSRAAAETAQRAEQASAAANAAVTNVQQQQDELYSKLATLQGTSEQVEKDYRQEQAQQAAFREQQRQAERNAAATRPQPPINGGRPPSNGGSGGGNQPAVPPVNPPPPPTGVDNSPAGAKAYAATQVRARGWGDDQFTSCLVPLWNKESNWRYDAMNRSSGAYGIPQSLPGDKMGTVAADWRTNSQTQILWGLSYIASRYKLPCAAWAHSQAKGWY